MGPRLSSLANPLTRPEPGAELQMVQIFKSKDFQFRSHSPVILPERRFYSSTEVSTSPTSMKLTDPAIKSARPSGTRRFWERRGRQQRNPLRCILACPRRRRLPAPRRSPRPWQKSAADGLADGRVMTPLLLPEISNDQKLSGENSDIKTASLSANVVTTCSSPCLHHYDRGISNMSQMAADASVGGEMSVSNEVIKGVVVDANSQEAKSETRVIQKEMLDADAKMKMKALAGKVFRVIMEAKTKVEIMEKILAQFRVITTTEEKNKVTDREMKKVVEEARERAKAKVEVLAHSRSKVVGDWEKHAIQEARAEGRAQVVAMSGEKAAAKAIEEAMAKETALVQMREAVAKAKTKAVRMATDKAKELVMLVMYAKAWTHAKEKVMAEVKVEAETKANVRVKEAELPEKAKTEPIEVDIDTIEKEKAEISDKTITESAATTKEESTAETKTEEQDTVKENDNAEFKTNADREVMMRIHTTFTKHTKAIYEMDMAVKANESDTRIKTKANIEGKLENVKIKQKEKVNRSVKSRLKTEGKSEAKGKMKAGVTRNSKMAQMKANTQRLAKTKAKGEIEARRAKGDNKATKKVVKARALAQVRVEVAKFAKEEEELAVKAKLEAESRAREQFLNDVRLLANKRAEAAARALARAQAKTSEAARKRAEAMVARVRAAAMAREKANLRPKLKKETQKGRVNYQWDINPEQFMLFNIQPNGYPFEASSGGAIPLCNSRNHWVFNIAPQ